MIALESRKNFPFSKMALYTHAVTLKECIVSCTKDPGMENG